MVNELKGLVLTELSLVDRGSNPLAHAPIFKRDNPQEETMTEEVKVDEVDAETTEVKRPAYKALYEEEQAKVAELEAKIEELEKAAVEKAAEPEEFIEVEGEQIAKSAIPAPILKALELAEFEKAEAAIQKRCAEVLPNVKEANARVLLKAADTADEDFLGFLKAVDALFDSKMEEVGKTDAETSFDSASDKLDAMIKGYSKEHGVAVHKATAEVLKTAEGRTLQKEAMKERK